VHVGYHGRSRQEDGEHVFGHCKWDNSDWVEDHFPFHSTHFHSLDETLIVGDGTPAFVFTSESVARPFIQLFKWDGERYVGPKILAFHRSTLTGSRPAGAATTSTRTTIPASRRTAGQCSIPLT